MKHPFLFEACAVHFTPALPFTGVQKVTFQPICSLFCMENIKPLVESLIEEAFLIGDVENENLIS